MQICTVIGDVIFGAEILSNGSFLFHQVTNVCYSNVGFMETKFRVALMENIFRSIRSHFGSSHLAQGGCLCVLISTTAFACSRFLFRVFFPCPHSVSRSRPPGRHRFFLTCHSAHQKMFGFQISRLRHNHRLSGTQVLLVLAALILPCVLPMVSLALACLPTSRQSYASTSQFSPTALPACRPICRQISELIAATTHTTKWMQDQQARCIEIDKTVANLHAPVQTGPAKDCRIRELQFEQTALSEPGSLPVRTRIQSNIFCEVSFFGVEDPCESKCKKGSDKVRLVFQSIAAFPLHCRKPPCGAQVR